MTWLMEVLKFYREEQVLIKYCVIKHLILQNIQKSFDKKKSGANTSATRARSENFATQATPNKFAGCVFKK